MAQTYSTELAGAGSLPVIKASALQGYAARPKRFRASVTLAAQAIGDTVVLAQVPPGLVFAGGCIVSDTSLATATVAVGNAGNPAKYKAAAALTVVDAPALFGKASAFAGAASTASEDVLLTVSTAALPAAGQLVVDLYFSSPN